MKTNLNSRIKRSYGAVRTTRSQLLRLSRGHAAGSRTGEEHHQMPRKVWIAASLFDEAAQDHSKHEAPVKCRNRATNTSPDFEEWDVLGLGQAMVDFAASVDDSMLDVLNVPKGGRRVITVSERAQIMATLEACESQVSAGGSLANTLVGLGQLAAAQDRATHGHMFAGSSSSSRHPHSVRVAMTGCVGGSDALGEFARAQLQAGGVDVVGPGPSSGATGVVMVFSTPDAQRSFLSSFSSEDSIELSEELQQTAARARLLLIEGYLYELPGAAEVIPQLVRHARKVGTLVALTAGDAGVVERHGAKVLEAIAAGVDMWLGNEAEAAALVQHLHKQQAEQQTLAQAALQKEQQQQQQPPWMVEDDDEQDFTAMQLERLGSGAANNSCSSSTAASPTAVQQQQQQQHSHNGQVAALQLASACPMVVVTDGSRGSYITALGQLVVVPPYWRANPPVDTCGAGDAYAAGLLYGFLMGLDLHSMGSLAAKTASAVISRHGPQLTPEDADWVVAGLPSKAGIGAGAAGSGVGVQHSIAASAAAAAAGINIAGRVPGAGNPGTVSSSSGWIGDWSGDVGC